MFEKAFCERLAQAAAEARWFMNSESLNRTARMIFEIRF